jgi:hypothetical protein
VLLTGILVLILEALRQVDSHIYQPMGVYPIPESPNKNWPSFTINPTYLLRIKQKSS